MLALDSTPVEIEALLSAPLEGLVVAGLGAGTLPPAVDPLLAAAARRIPVLMTTPHRSGRSLRRHLCRGRHHA